MFLIRDFDIVRIPNEKLRKQIKYRKDLKLIKIYEEKVVSFFESYEACSDGEELAVILLNPMKYSIIEVLRNEFLSVDELRNRIERNVKHFDMMLEELVEQQVVYVHKEDDGTDLVMLITDIRPIEIFPAYIMDNLTTQYNNKEILPELAVKHLDFLERNYR